MRSLSTDFIRALLDPNSDVWGVIFLTVAHPNLSPPIRVAADVTAMKSGAAIPYVLSGKSYTTYPFDLALPDDTDEIPETKITIQNVDSKIGQAVKDIPADQPLSLTLQIYASSDFAINGGGTQMEAVGTPTQQYEWPLALIRNVTWDASSFTGTVKSLDPSREPWPCLRATPDIAPGLSIT